LNKVLLTGSSGFLGKILMQHVCQKCSIKTLSRSTGDYVFRLEDGIPCFDDNFDLVIHAAGLAHSAKKIGIDDFQKVNVLGTLNLLRGLENSAIPRMLIFISSVAVYGQAKGSLINEDASLRALDAYGQSKIDAEFVVINWCQLNNVTLTILRLPLLVGDNPPGNLGSMIKGIKSGWYFNIGGGTAKKSMVLSEDVANFVLKVAPIGGIYNLTDGYHPTFSELSERIATQCGQRLPLNLPMFAAKLLAMLGDLLGPKFPFNSEKLVKITSELTFDDSKARKNLGWSPTPVLEGFLMKKLHL